MILTPAPFQHGILQWQPPVFQQIKQLRIKDEGQNVSHLSWIAVPAYSCLWNCKAAPAVGLAAGSRHSPPLLGSLLCKPPGRPGLLLFEEPGGTTVTIPRHETAGSHSHTAWANPYTALLLLRISVLSVVQELTNPIRPHTKGEGSYGFKTLPEEETVKETVWSPTSPFYSPLPSFSSFPQKECCPCDQRSLKSTIKWEQAKDKQNMQCRLL